jgi:hypothetical protein
MKQEIIEIKDSSSKLIAFQLRSYIKAGFYIKRFIQLEKTSFMLIVEAENIEKCFRDHEKILMKKPLEE